MVKEKLIIDGTVIPLDSGISTVLTYSIKDIVEPDKVKSSFSKTITIPGSKVVNDLLNFIFEVNIDGTYNPNLKLDSTYYQDDIAVFSGFIQLKDVIKNDYNQVDYQVVLFGETANVFRELGNKFLDDAGMNWSELDHDYTQTNQALSWDTSYVLNGTPTAFAYGSGYTYPMINYGNDTDISVYNVNEMFPAIYAKEYIDRMFADAGYTYTSTFLNSTIFKHLIIPFNGQVFKPNQTALATRRIKADTPLMVTSGTNNQNLDTSVTGYATSGTPNLANQIRLTNETIDADNQYNPATGDITIGATGSYRVSFDVLTQFDITPKAGAAAPGDLALDGSAHFKNFFSIEVNGVTANSYTSYVLHTGLSPAVTYQTASPSTYPDTDFRASGNTTRNYNPPNRYNVILETTLQVGDVVTVNLNSYWQYFIQPQSLVYEFPYRDSSNNGYHADYKIYLLSANLSLETLDSPYLEGDSISMASCVPEKIKQRDFLTSIIKMFNLYMFPDPDNNKNMIIETREDFYNETVKDWRAKLDYSQPMNLTPTAVTNNQKYVYSYKDDADYYNKKYLSGWLDTYGVANVYIANDFNKDEFKTEVIFSATPLVGQLTNDRVISTIVTVDANNQQKTTKSNIRILYYDGMKSSLINWNHQAIAGDILRGTYPYAGHFDDPYSATLDLNFGLVREIYYDNTYGTITITDNGLYNQYHKRELEQLTDKDSKIFKGYFLLNPVDMINLSFQDKYWFENSYWRLHKVEYASNEYKPSKCEFLRLFNVLPYVESTEVITGGTGTIGDFPLPGMHDDTLSGDNLLKMKSVEVQGKDNYVSNDALKISIQGDGNKVFSESYYITITGDNNVIESNLTNINLINTSNVTVTESNVTYINGVKQAGGEANVIIQTSVNTTGDIQYKGYEYDTSGGNRRFTPGTAVGKEGVVWSIKKISTDSNSIDFILSGSETIDDLTSLSIYNYNTTLVIYSNGENWKIR